MESFISVSLVRRHWRTLPSDLKPTPWPQTLLFTGRSTVPWTTAWPFLNLCCFFFQPHALFFFLSSSSSLPFPMTLLFFFSFTLLIFLISPHSPLDTIVAPLCFHLFSSCITPHPPTGCISILYAILLCPYISLFSAPLRLANYFCSIVHSVWGWTRTPPWPPVRGERLSGTKTSLAPLFFSFLFLPLHNLIVTVLTTWLCMRSYKVQILPYPSEDTEVNQTEVYVSLIRLRAEDQNEAVRFT